MTASRIVAAEGILRFDDGSELRCCLTTFRLLLQKQAARDAQEPTENGGRYRQYLEGLHRGGRL